MPRKRLIFASAAAVLGLALASLRYGAASPRASLSPGASARELAEPVAYAHAEPPTADSTTKSADSVDDAELAPEPALMQGARDAVGTDPRRTLALIEAADRRFGPLSEARRVLEIEALVTLQMIGLSHSRAEHFYRTFPNSQAAREVERLTGYHPRPRGP